MTQYLVTTFKDSTGRPHEHFTTARVIKGLQLLRQRVKKKQKRSTRCGTNQLMERPT
ncbi:hypothetical protein O957_01387 [Staphylococcus aureus M0962]|nr:hypothetical protein O957_01387 [Staphylococcus aureus M0962]